MFYDGLDNGMLFMVIVLPVFYLFITIFLIVYYCKYRKIHSQYQVLRESEEGGHNNNHPQVELENQSPKV
jgi:Na+/melibiose symporter-like transporter